MHAVPCRVLLEIGAGMLDGGCKYGTHNYRAAGVRASAYYDAVMRHIMAWWEGEDIDAESGLPHVVKAMSTLVVLRDSMIAGNWVDDRPPQVPGGAGVSELNKLASEIIDRYPRPVAPFTHKPEVRELFVAAAEAKAQVVTCCQCARFNGGLGGPAGCNHVDPNTDASAFTCFVPMTPAEPFETKHCGNCGKTCPVDDGYVRDMPCASWVPQKMAAACGNCGQNCSLAGDHPAGVPMARPCAAHTFKVEKS